MRRRTRKMLWIEAAVLMLLAVAVFLRSKAPPEAARLLPESDGIIYVNLKPFRAFLHKDLKPPQRVPEPCGRTRCEPSFQTAKRETVRGGPLRLAPDTRLCPSRDNSPARRCRTGFGGRLTIRRRNSGS